MKPLKFYKYATWGLLILNLSMLSFFIITRGGAHGRHGASPRATDLLKLTEQQNTQFLASAKQHDQIMNRINLEQSSLLKPYFSQLTTPNKEDKNVASAATLEKLQILEKRKIEATYQHFEEVKSILREEQLPDFKIFMDTILPLIINSDKKNPHPPKDS